MASQLGGWATLSGRYNSGLWTLRDNQRWKPLLEAREVAHPQIEKPALLPTLDVAHPPTLPDVPSWDSAKRIFQKLLFGFRTWASQRFVSSGKRPNRTI